MLQIRYLVFFSFDILYHFGNGGAMAMIALTNTTKTIKYATHGAFDSRHGLLPLRLRLMWKTTTSTNYLSRHRAQKQIKRTRKMQQQCMFQKMSLELAYYQSRLVLLRLLPLPTGEKCHYPSRFGTRLPLQAAANFWVILLRRLHTFCS